MESYSENQTSQMVKVAPPRFVEDYSALADAIFGSNSSLLLWSSNFEYLNKESLESSEICGFNSHSGACTQVLVHTHTHTHTLQ